MTTFMEGKIFDSIQMMPDEIEYMVNRVRSLKGDMVEWGSGGSTEMWLANLPAGCCLTSIEHNKDWHDKVELLREAYPKACFAPTYVDVSSPHFFHGYGDVAEEVPFNVAQYVWPHHGLYDANLYFIDGIARGACLAGILLSAKPNVEIYIHDYFPRVMAYEWITQYRTVEKVGTTLAKIS